MVSSKSPGFDRDYTVIVRSLNRFLTKELVLEQHVKILAILNIVFGAMGVLSAILILVLFGGLAALVSSDAQQDPGAAALLGGIGGIGAILIGVLSLPSLIAGVGLLKFRPWGQT